MTKLSVIAGHKIFGKLNKSNSLMYMTNSSKNEKNYFAAF